MAMDPFAASSVTVDGSTGSGHLGVKGIASVDLRHTMWHSQSLKLGGVGNTLHLVCVVLIHLTPRCLGSGRGGFAQVYLLGARHCH